MPIINFKKEFADDVESGRKLQTIRPERKFPINRGDTLYLYTGLRTRHVRRLGKARCTSVSDIEINEGLVVIDNNFIYPDAVERFARKDGFKNGDAMVEFFRKLYGLPFYGKVIRWVFL